MELILSALHTDLQIYHAGKLFEEESSLSFIGFAIMAHRQTMAHDWRRAPSDATTLTEKDLRALLKQGPVQFIVNDVAVSHRLIPLQECYEFWKAEVQPHLAEPGSRIVPENFPREYCYIAFNVSNEHEIPPKILPDIHH